VSGSKGLPLTPCDWFARTPSGVTRSTRCAGFGGILDLTPALLGNTMRKTMAKIGTAQAPTGQVDTGSSVLGVSRQTALHETVSKLLGDASYQHIIRRYHEGLDAAFFNKDWVDVVYQHPDRDRCTLTDAAVFAALWTAIQLGNLLSLRIPLGRTPFSDEELLANNAALQALPPHFGATLWGRNFEQDGVLEWNVPIQMARSKVGEPLVPTEVQPSKSPLEVGYTDAPTTFSHLRSNRGLARWPYGHAFLTLLWLPPQNELNLWLPNRESGGGLVAPV
jgi:hypothetical protein